ncbi:MAG: hypothetical protein HY272_09935 [Gammaproteobacteria bacterium]|nr:hypothetical protein [Gammaproteobacteria bacterium]
MNLFKKIFVMGVFAVASGFWPVSGFCAGPKEDVFETNLFQTIEISSFAINPEKLTKLTAVDKKDLLLAKDVLRRFFISLDDSDGNYNQYLSPAFFAGKTLNRQDIRKKIIADETDLLKIGITNFDFNGNRKTVVFDFYAIVYVEGVFSLGEGKAQLEKHTGSWNISGITINRP